MQALSQCKPWRNVKEQIQLLQSKGVLIANENEAADLLLRFGYYRLSGYSYPLRELDPSTKKRIDHFQKGTTFEYIIQLYEFDKKLRLLILDALERIEISLRVSVSYYLGEHDPVFYKDSNNFDPSFLESDHGDWLEKQSKQLDHSREDCITHNLKKYGKQLPIWIVCQSWDFGQLARLLTGLNSSNKTKIGNHYGFVGGRAFASWIRSFNLLRNICAHHSRLWNRKFTLIPEWPKKTDSPTSFNWEPILKEEERRLLFFQICGLVYFLRFIEPNSLWTERMKSFIRTFPDSKGVGIGLSEMGFPKNWEELIDLIKK